MQNTEFVFAIKSHVRKEAVSAYLGLIANPPGRAPEAELVELSKWYNGLDDQGKSMVRRVVEQSVDAGFFSLFCVLDGITPIEKTDEQGSFELYYVKGAEKVLLTDPDEDYLHDLYNAR